MEAFVDQETCIGCGICPSMCPEVFEMNDDGKAYVIVDTVPEGKEDSAVESKEACPVNAIQIEK